MLNRVACLQIGLVTLAFAAPTLTALAADQPPPAADTSKLETIIVTAEHKTEDVNTVPMSITALTGDQMEQQGIKKIDDVARFVPGLNFQQQGDSFGSTEISIRGIASKTGAAPTGIYIDDTPIQVRLSGFTGTTNPYPKIFDLDRIEVLKGPQGTLFGAGSEGGTVRFITPEPSLDTWSGVAHLDGSITDGGDPNWEAGVAVGGPIVEDKIGFRASAWVQQDGGWVDRLNYRTGAVTEPNSNWDSTDAFRLAVKMVPNDNLTITPSVYYQDDYTHDTSLWWLDNGHYKGTPGNPPPDDAGRYHNLSQFAQPDDDHFYLTGLTAEYRFDPFTVKSITSWFHRTDNRQSDESSFDLSEFVPHVQYGTYYDYGGIYLPDGASFPSHGFFQNTQEDFDEELRISSNDQQDERFSWNAGLFFQHNRQGLFNSIAEPLVRVANDPTVISNYGETCSPGHCTVADLLGTGMIGPYSYLDDEVQHEQEEAAYANLTYHVTEAIRLEAGVRGARSLFDFEDIENGAYNSHLSDPNDPNSPYVALSVSSATKKEYPVTPRFSLSYDVAPGQMIYATAAKGYRIGGGNEDLSSVGSCKQDFANLGIPGDPLTYNSDTVWSYELGTKAKLLDGSVQIDAAAFWINWANIQSLVYLPICGYSYTQNLGNAVSRGGELTAQWRVMPGLTLSGNIAYTDAHYTSTTVVGGNILAKSGDSLGTPPLTFTISAEHDQDLGDDMNLYIRGDFEFASHYVRTGSETVYTYDPVTRPGLATENLGARIGVTKGPWDLSVYGQNLLNKNTILFVYHDTYASPGVRAESMTPLTLGMTADYRF